MVQGCSSLATKTSPAYVKIPKELHCPLCGRLMEKVNEENWRCLACKRRVRAYLVYSLEGTNVGLLIRPEGVED